MVITIAYPVSGTVRVYENLTQAEVNRIISHISHLKDTEGDVNVKIKVIR